MASESLRVTKLAPVARLSDRYLTVQIKEAPESEQADSFGRLCALVEIEGSWQTNSQIGQTIINTVARQYYRGTLSHPLANFEAALKRVNETLKQTTQTGSTDWIGHLHAALVVVVGSEIHIATTGQVYSTLFREQKATLMTDPNAESSSASGNIFSTLLSGVIEPGDQLIIASSGLHKLFSGREIEQLIAESGQDLAAGFNTLLQSKRGSWIHALLIDAPSVSSADQAPIMTTVTIESGSMNWRTGMSTLTTQAKKQLKPLQAWFLQTTTSVQAAVTTKLLPTSKARLAQTKTWSTQRLGHLATNVLPNALKGSQTLWAKLMSSVGVKKSALPIGRQASITTPTEQPSIQPESNLPTSSQAPNTPQVENLIGRSVYAIRDYSLATDSLKVTDYQEPAMKRRPLIPGLHVKVPKLTGLLAHIEWRSVLFGLIALVLFIILASNIRVITNQRQTEQSTQQLTTQLSILKDKLEEARLARIFNQPEKAAEALEIVLAGLPPLLDSSIKESAQLLEEKAQGELDELTGTTRLTELKKIASLPNGTKMTQSGNLLIAIDGQGKLTRIDADTGTTSEIAIPGNPAAVSLTAYDNQAGIVILTDAPSVFVLTPGQEQLSPLTTTDEWKAGTSLTSFFGNLYILSPSNNQIWKYTSAQAGFSKAEAYISGDTKIESAIDLAIDGQIYLLQSNGSVSRLNRGKTDNFALGSPPQPTASITNPKQIYTTKDSSRLYLLDGKRILSFDKSGAFQTQYAFKGINDIQAFSIDEGKKILTILAHNELYTTSF